MQTLFGLVSHLGYSLLFDSHEELLELKSGKFSPNFLRADLFHRNFSNSSRFCHKVKVMDDGKMDL